MGRLSRTITDIEQFIVHGSQFVDWIVGRFCEIEIKALRTAGGHRRPRCLIFVRARAMWEHFRHQADIGVRGVGDSMAQAFEEGAVALMAVMCQPDKVEPKNEIQINCEAPDPELLFADWLSVIIYEAATRRMLFGRFEVQIAGDKLSGKAWGEKADTEKHKTIVEVKGATYAELKVGCNEDGRWVAQCVVDV